MSVRTLFAILALALSIKANATNYYFSDSQGDDSRSSKEAQNPSTPWKSIDKLNSFFSNIKPGDQLLFKCGDVFYGAIKTTKSGTTSAPITFSSYGSGSKPVISGLIKLSVWNYIGNGIYESATLPTGAQVNMVLINSKQYAMGRYPNVSNGNDGYLNFESHGYKYFNDNENPLSSDWNGAQLVVRTCHYTMERATITNVSGKTISYSPSFGRALTDKYGYFVQNSIKTLDQYGEWYYNPNTKKIAVYFGSNGPKGNKVRLSAEDILLTVQNSHIVVDNLAFTGANQYAIFGDWAGVSDLQVRNCSIDFSGIDGIALANRHDFVMDNTTITNSNSVGVSLYLKNYNPVIKNSTISNTGIFAGMLWGDRANRYGNGVFSTEGLTATNNKVISSGYMGIVFFGNNNLIKNNYVDTFCTVLDDGGGIYTGNFTYPGQQPAICYNRKIVNNIVLHGIGAKGGTYDSNPNYLPAEGIYLDDYTNDVQVFNNTAAYCSDAGIYVHNTRYFSLTDNVLFNNGSMQLGFQHDNLGFSIQGGLIKHNQLFSKSASQYVLRLQSKDNDIANFGSFDSNYYCRPSNEEKIMVTNWFNNKQNWYNLSGWQSSLNKDWNTRKTPVPVTDSSSVSFHYNASTSAMTYKLNGIYVSLNGTRYAGKLELAPFTSIILLKTTGSSNATESSSMNISAAAITDTSMKAPRYVKTEVATLTVKAYPNPSSYYFNVTVQGGSDGEPMKLQVLDLSGRLMQVKTGITANSTLQVGQALAPGSYVLELIQGSKRVEQKVIKLSK